MDCFVHITYTGCVDGRESTFLIWASMVISIGCPDVVNFMSLNVGFFNLSSCRAPCCDAVELLGGSTPWIHPWSLSLVGGRCVGLVCGPWSPFLVWVVPVQSCLDSCLRQQGSLCEATDSLKYRDMIPLWPVGAATSQLCELRSAFCLLPSQSSCPRLRERLTGSQNRSHKTPGPLCRAEALALSRCCLLLCSFPVSSGSLGLLVLEALCSPQAETLRLLAQLLPVWSWPPDRACCASMGCGLLGTRCPRRTMTIQR